MIRDYQLRRGDLVLVRHTAIEKSLNRKMRPRYIGPLIVLSRNRGGAYIVCELDGSVWDRPVARFRVLPYKARRSIPMPDLSRVNVSTTRLRQMELSRLTGDEEDEDAEDS